MNIIYIHYKYYILYIIFYLLYIIYYIYIILYYIIFIIIYYIIMYIYICYIIYICSYILTPWFTNANIVYLQNDSEHWVNSRCQIGSVGRPNESASRTQVSPPTRFTVKIVSKPIESFSLSSGNHSEYHFKKLGVHPNYTWNIPIYI